MNLLGWVFVVICVSVVLYGLFGVFRGEYFFGVEESVVYNVFYRSVWGVVVCWVIFVCVIGNGGLFYVNLFKILYIN